MTRKLIILFGLALVLRLLFVFVAHHGDLNNNISWGEELLSRGFSQYYGSSDANDWPYSAPNQPPLYILFFGGVVWLFNAIKSASWWMNNSIGIFPSSFIWFWEAKGMDLTVKLPGILADLGIGWLVYSYLRQKAEDKKHSKNMAMTIAGIWLFNPITWYNSSIWGQTDPIVNLLGLVGIIALSEKKLVKFAFWFTLSFLFKGSLAIFIPVLLLIIIKQQYPRRDYFLATLYVLLVTFLVSVWFHPSIDFPFWLFSLYRNRILPGEIGYLTANAFNFWWLVDSGKTLDSTIYLGLPARLWGLVLAFGGIGGTGIWLTRGKWSDKRIFLSLAVVSLITFLFMTRIHERYLFPFFPYATLLIGVVPGFWIPYVIFSTTHLFNMYHLFWAPSFASFETLYQNPSFSLILSVINIVTFVYLLRLLRRTRI